MPGARAVATALFVALCCQGSLRVSARPSQDKRQIISRARRSYYNLRQLGLSEFHATLQPNWSVIINGVEGNPQALRTLNALRFWMVLTADDQVKVDHQVTLPAPSDQV